mmetsp:Transcript_10238/g.20648  ORF Transcript_10238/g.20648 Transcript_10238/m.20648 type:complete len:264 (-) Transcript_10238:833-1624(-)
MNNGRSNPSFCDDRAKYIDHTSISRLCSSMDGHGSCRYNHPASGGYGGFMDERALVCRQGLFVPRTVLSISRPGCVTQHFPKQEILAFLRFANISLQPFSGRVNAPLVCPWSLGGTRWGLDRYQTQLLVHFVSFPKTYRGMHAKPILRWRGDKRSQVATLTGPDKRGGFPIAGFRFSPVCSRRGLASVVPTPKLTASKVPSWETEYSQGRKMRARDSSASWPVKSQFIIRFKQSLSRQEESFESVSTGPMMTFTDSPLASCAS